MRGFVLACALAVVAAQNMSLFSFSGNFPSGAATVNSAYISTSDGMCYSTSSNYYYTTFNYTFATAGVYAIYGFNIPFVGVQQGPSSLNLTDLCMSSPPVFPLTAGSNYYIGADNTYGHWFNASTYTFVVGASSSGPFGGEIWNGMYNGQTTGTGATNKTWAPVYDNSGCTEYSSASLYDAQLATVPTSGYYQVFLAWSQNVALDPSYQVPYSNPTLTVLQGDMTAADLSAADCASLGNAYVYGKQGDALNVQLFDVWMNAGTNYTFIATGGYQSSYGSYVGHYTITLTPGKTLYFTNITTFGRPQYGSCGSTLASSCVAYASPNKGQAYSYTTFTVPKNTYFFLYAQQGKSQDLEFFIYNEINVPLLTCGTLGQTCRYTEDSIDGKTYFSGNSDKFTIIATNYYTDDFGSEGYFTFYMLSGAALPGYYISSAPTSPTTLAPATAAPTATGTTTAPTLKPGTCCSHA